MHKPTQNTSIFTNAWKTYSTWLELGIDDRGNKFPSIDVMGPKIIKYLEEDVDINNWPTNDHFMYFGSDFNY